MIVVDTGPLVALFNPQDADHAGCREVFEAINERLYTTEAVLTEAFHLLNHSAGGLMEFILQGCIEITSLDIEDMARAFELMDKYADCPMDFADASLVVLAERLRTLSVFTIDNRDFNIYRIRIGHEDRYPEILQ